MPKIKTRSSAKKRFKKTGTGKIKIEKVAHKHQLLQKSKRQKRKAKKGLIVTDADKGRLKRLLPNMGL